MSFIGIELRTTKDVVKIAGLALLALVVVTLGWWIGHLFFSDDRADILQRNEVKNTAELRFFAFVAALLFVAAAALLLMSWRGYPHAFEGSLICMTWYACCTIKALFMPQPPDPATHWG